MPILGAVDTVLEEGASGTSVKALQQALIAVGYDVGHTGADGVYGAGTKAAVEAFQQASGLAVDGIAGPQTMTALARAAGAARGAAQAVQGAAAPKGALTVRPTAAAAAPGSGKKILLWGLLGVGLLFILKGLGAGSFGDPPAFKDFEDRSGLDPDDDDDDNEVDDEETDTEDDDDGEA